MHEIQECPDFRGRKMARRMIGVQRIDLARPVSEDIDEFATLQPGAEPQFQALEDALSGETGFDRGRGIVRHHPPRYVNVKLFAVP